MFSASGPQTEFEFPKDNPLKFEYNYASVLQFVSKSQQIPKLIAELEEGKDENDKRNIQALKEAINKGNAQDPIFTNPKAQIYLLYLLKNSPDFSYDNFMTANAYILALMEYSADVPLKEQDMHLKHVTEVKTFSIDDLNIKNKILDHLKENYFLKRDQYYSDYEWQIKKKQIEQAMNVVTGFGKIVIRWKRPLFKSEDPTSNFYPTVERIPFVAYDKNYFYLPSMQLIQAIMSVLNLFPYGNYDVAKQAPQQKNHVSIAVIFGAINERTLYRFHQSNMQPVNLYLREIKNNPVKLDDLPTTEKGLGPFSIMVHDLFHWAWANRFESNEHKFLFEYVIPTLAKKFDIKRIDAKDNFMFPVIDINYDSLFYTPNIRPMSAAMFYICRGNSDESSIRIIQFLLEHKDEIENRYKIHVENYLSNSFVMSLLGRGLDNSDISARYRLVDEALKKGVDPYEYYKANTSKPSAPTT